MQKAPYVFPIIGGRKVEHLKQNLQGLDVALSEEHIKYLESILPFDLGFPTGRFVSLYVLEYGYDDELITPVREMVPTIISYTRMQAPSTNGLSSKPFVRRSCNFVMAILRILSV